MVCQLVGQMVYKVDNDLGHYAKMQIIFFKSDYTYSDSPENEYKL